MLKDDFLNGSKKIMIGEYIEDSFKIDEYDKHKFPELVMCLKRVEEVEFV